MRKKKGVYITMKRANRVVSAAVALCMAATMVAPVWAAAPAAQSGEQQGQVLPLPKKPMYDSATASSAEANGMVNGDGLAKLAFDGRVGHAWHSQYSNAPTPHYIEWDLTKQAKTNAMVTGIRYEMKNHDNGGNGRWQKIKIYSQTKDEANTENWTDRGEYTISSGNEKISFDVAFEAAKMKVEVKQSVRNYACAGEITVYGTDRYTVINQADVTKKQAATSANGNGPDKAFDGDANTHWESNWNANGPGLLGWSFANARTVAGIQYTPRYQVNGSGGLTDGGANGQWRGTVAVYGCVNAPEDANFQNLKQKIAESANSEENADQYGQWKKLGEVTFNDADYFRNPIDIIFTQPTEVTDLVVKINRSRVNSDNNNDKDFTAAEINTYELVSKENPAPVEIVGSSVTLGGTIGMNVVYRMDSSLTSEQQANLTMKVKIDDPTEGAVTEYTLKCADGKAVEQDNYQDCKQLTVPIAARQMTDKITVTLMDGENQIGAAQEFKVQKYAEDLIASQGNSNEKLKHILIYMLQYGAAMQNYKGYKTNDLANAHYRWDGEVDGVTAANIAAVNANKPVVVPEGLSVQASLQLYGDTAMGFYFDNDAVAGKEFTVDNGLTVKQSEKNGKAYVEVGGIRPDQLADQIVLHVGDLGDVKISPMNYAESVVKDSTSSAALQKVVKAMFRYYEAAVAYKTAQ